VANDVPRTYPTRAREISRKLVKIRQCVTTGT
jgi:hypothetical protein